MFDFIIYLGQSALCLAALYLIYKVAMSHETLHYFNRVLLLGSVLLSALLPLCRVKIVKEYDPAPTLASIEIDDMVVADVADVALGIDYVSLLKDLAVMVFFVGVAFMLVRLAVGIYSVWRLIHSGQMSVIEDDVTLTVVDNLSSPFSWFGHIVASQSDVQQFRGMILAHELAHIRLRHSWDVMFVDVALCLWWFNPAMWLLRRELQSLHEYQADDAVLNGGVDAKSYQMLLIKRAVGSRLHSVANCLNHSNLNNRITMMCKKNSSRWAATKALLVVPMVAVAMGAFATTVYVPREVQDKVTENSVNLQDEEKPKPIVIIDGKVVAYEEMSKIDPNTIGDMSVLKDKSAKEVVAELGLNVSEEDVKNGVVVIRLKKEGNTAVLDNATENKVIVFADGQSQGEPKTQSSTISILGNNDNTKMTTVQFNTQGEGKKTLIVNGQNVPYEKISEISSEKIKDIVINKFDNNSSVVNITLKGSAQSTLNPDDKPYIKVEKMPTFNGGKSLVGFQNWIQNNIRYPKEALAKGVGGRVIFQFVVERDGTPTSFNVLQSPDKSLSDEVERIFKTSPKWEAGEQNGEKVRVIYTVPVVFTTPSAETQEFEQQKQEFKQYKDLREALQMNLRGVGNLYGVIEVRGVLSKDNTFSRLKISRSTKEENKDLAPLIKEVSRALSVAANKIKVKNNIHFNYEISFEVKTDDGVLSSKVPVGDDAIVVMAYAGSKSSKQKDEPYIKVEKMPTFQGGDLNTFRNWVQSQIQYPKEAMEKNISGRVIFSFVVEKDGSTSDFTVLQTPDKLLADEVERIFKSCPKWEPGTQRGEKVRVKYTVPIVFAVEK